ncbi:MULTISPECIES: hypothetical protein [unclassified Mesorhizobium]|uniref:hypothetical protein n=1 Tax=unclassified Mesorhizobium TaxID=325217 RepID=UPI00112982C3|nr:MULTISPECIES: hypothetical protein [unclassified Mesorhizobium]TPM96773.1 hypothetical protein FJ977_19650 [Mesorhizobium sp. B2-1-3A]BCG88541.1 hypothetical protein MesoLj113c_46510 [Mesorhizobium sp. 113-3-9]
MAVELPAHVKKYLDDMEVSADALPEDAWETFASLSGGEIALLRKLGKDLEEADDGIVIKVH